MKITSALLLICSGVLFIAQIEKIKNEYANWNYVREWHFKQLGTIGKYKEATKEYYTQLTYGMFYLLLAFFFFCTLFNL